jgi:hypothetical protein
MLKQEKNDVLVNGKINCRKFVNLNVVFYSFLIMKISLGKFLNYI